jgi:hypothetical protein
MPSRDVDLAGLTPPVEARTIGAMVNHHVLTEAALEAAVRMLFCLEVRGAVNKGELDQQRQRWIRRPGRAGPGLAPGAATSSFPIKSPERGG